MFKKKANWKEIWEETGIEARVIVLEQKLREMNRRRSGMDLEAINLETLGRLDNIGKICADMDRRLELMRPLTKHLMPLRMEWQKDGIPDDDQVVTLRIDNWQKQYNADIDKCVGINIRWV